jgi:plasmid stabilization system protein ParE
MAWYRKQQQGLDRAFLTEIDAAIERVRQNPESYPKRYREYRAVLVRRFPFVMYFRIVGDEVRVAAVLHYRRGATARDRRLPAGRR